VKTDERELPDGLRGRERQRLDRFSRQPDGIS
jgi:hypothetical protein